jgi:hypothetical protein
MQRTLRGLLPMQRAGLKDYSFIQFRIFDDAP